MNGASEIYKVLVADTTVKSLVSTLTIYQSGTEGAADVYDVNHTVNCRSSTEKKAKELAQAVKSALHRVTFFNIGFVCFVEPVIPPQDDTDNFNAPVTVRVIGTK